MVQYAIATTGPGWEVSAPAAPTEDRMPPPTGMRAPTGAELTHDELVLLLAEVPLVEAYRAMNSGGPSAGHAGGQSNLGSPVHDSGTLTEAERDHLMDGLLRDCVYAQLHFLDFLRRLGQSQPTVLRTPREVQMQRIQARDGAQ